MLCIMLLLATCNNGAMQTTKMMHQTINVSRPTAMQIKTQVNCSTYAWKMKHKGARRNKSLKITAIKHQSIKREVVQHEDRGAMQTKGTGAPQMYMSHEAVTD